MSEQMRCGQCGTRRVTLRAVGGSERYFEIRARCCKCKSVTVFSVTEPKIEVGWGKGAKGILCTGWAPRAKGGAS